MRKHKHALHIRKLLCKLRPAVVIVIVYLSVWAKLAH